MNPINNFVTFEIHTMDEISKQLKNELENLHAINVMMDGVERMFQKLNDERKTEGILHRHRRGNPEI